MAKWLVRWTLDVEVKGTVCGDRITVVTPLLKFLAYFLTTFFTSFDDFVIAFTPSECCQRDVKKLSKLIRNNMEW